MLDLETPEVSTATSLHSESSGKLIIRTLHLMCLQEGQHEGARCPCPEQRWSCGRGQADVEQRLQASASLFPVPAEGDVAHADEELSRMQRSSRRCIGLFLLSLQTSRWGCPTLAAVLFRSLRRAARPLGVLLREEPALSSLVRHSLGEHVPAQLLVVFLETLRASLQSLVLLCKPRKLFLSLVKPMHNRVVRPGLMGALRAWSWRAVSAEWAEVARVRAS